MLILPHPCNNLRHPLFSRLCLTLILLLSCAHQLTAQERPSTAGTGAKDFTYQTPSGVTFRVTAEGLSAIRYQNREVANGSWSCFSAENWFKDGGSQQVKTDPTGEKSLTVLDAHHARVRQVKGNVVATFDYNFESEDLTISTRLENNHATAPLNITGFTGLTFNFDKLPDGLMPVQHITYFQANGIQLCHPGYWSPIGGSYATDNSLGIGLSPWNVGLTRTLILWDYVDWNADKRDKVPQRRPIYFVVNPVPSRGAMTFDLRLRISPNRDWHYLLEPYRQEFQRTYGPVRYKADYRWIATDYLNHSVQEISPTNPYGFQSGHRRFDLAEGVKAFCDEVIPTLQGANGQGAIVWGQGGEEPRGQMYRPDFDVLPPEVEANWTTLAQRFKAANLKLGVATRPRDMAVRQNWKQDEIISINPDDPSHRDMLWRRFENMRNKGCTLFYLDSFGDSFEDVKLMRFLREKLGPDVLTFAEHQCDAIMPYSGGYSETTLQAEPTDNPPYYRLWSGVDNWQIYQWLAPGAQMAARLYQTQGKAPANFETSEHFFYSNRITPLIPVSELNRTPSLKQWQPQFLNANGQWVAH
ncbi:MAG: hypothetical protein JO316_16675 [Abitibacteriaceae bacterium]|nr:hypothetical protein [Abditibacteriaceae bacterium]